MQIVDSLLIVPLLCGGAFILAGLIMLIYPPKKINGLYGYRTPNSMKSQERWDFAQKYSSLELIKAGTILLLGSTFGVIFDFGDELAIIFGLCLMIAVIVVLFIRVEKAIKKHFPEST